MTEQRPAGKAKKIWLLGDVITIKATGKETGGKYSVWEINAPSLSGPPPHQEEAFYVLEGEFSFQYNEMVINATTGSFTNIQKGVVHTYKNTSKSTGRLLVTVIPAGFENFFEELGVPVTDDKGFTQPTDPPDIARIVDVSTKHGVIYVPELKKENY